MSTTLTRQEKANRLEELNNRMFVLSRRLESAPRTLTTFSGEAIPYLSDVLKLARRINQNSFDQMTSFQYLSIQLDDGRLYLRDRQHDLSLFLTGNSLAQMCTTFNGVPSSYLKRCLSSDKEELARHNLEQWLRAQPQDQNVLLRATRYPEEGGMKRLHGFLSSRYTCFDDVTVTHMVDNIIGPQGGFSVLSYCVDPELLRLRLVSDRKLTLPATMREQYLGLDIGNSRVGLSSLHVHLMIYDHYCTNGMIFRNAESLFFRRRHIGTFGSEISSSFQQVLASIPDFLTFAQEQITRAQMTVLTRRDLEYMISQFQLKVMNADSVKEQIDEKMAASGYGMTVWGFLGAITEVAQRYNLEQRERIEEYAGNLLCRVTAPQS